MSVSMSVSVRMSALICASIISIRVALNVIDIMQIHKELNYDWEYETVSNWKFLHSTHHNGLSQTQTDYNVETMPLTLSASCKYRVLHVVSGNIVMVCSLFQPSSYARNWSWGLVTQIFVQKTNRNWNRGH